MYIYIDVYIFYYTCRVCERDLEGELEGISFFCYLDTKNGHLQRPESSWVGATTFNNNNYFSLTRIYYDPKFHI